MGGHLFAIAARVSSREGFDGYMYGYAANTRLARHYVEALGADLVGILHPYHVVFDEIAAQRLLEVYDFDWTDERV